MNPTDSPLAPMARTVVDPQVRERRFLTATPWCREELAHALLHENFKDRALAGLEAESTAFIICKVLGIDSSEYSFGYVGNWAGGGEQAIAGITASCQNIQKAAVTILGHFEVGEQEVAA